MSPSAFFHLTRLRGGMDPNGALSTPSTEEGGPEETLELSRAQRDGAFARKATVPSRAEALCQEWQEFHEGLQILDRASERELNRVQRRRSPLQVFSHAFFHLYSALLREGNRSFSLRALPSIYRSHLRGQGFDSPGPLQRRRQLVRRREALDILRNLAQQRLLEQLSALAQEQRRERRE